MRTLTIGLALLASLSVASIAEAGRDKGRSRDDGRDTYGAYDHRRASDRSHRARRHSGDSEADIIRAESCDPAGRFDGYPAWARAAFTCGSQR